MSLHTHGPGRTPSAESIYLGKELLSFRKEESPLEVRINETVLASNAVTSSNAGWRDANRTERPAGATGAITGSNARPAANHHRKNAKSDDGKYVLVDSAGTTYQLDDQSAAKKFNGKAVKVSGTVDTSSNTIHVTEIKPAA